MAYWTASSVDWTSCSRLFRTYIKHLDWEKFSRCRKSTRERRHLPWRGCWQNSPNLSGSPSHSPSSLALQASSRCQGVLLYTDEEPHSPSPPKKLSKINNDARRHHYLFIFSSYVLLRVTCVDFLFLRGWYSSCYCSSHSHILFHSSYSYSLLSSTTYIIRYLRKFSSFFSYISYFPPRKRAKNPPVLDGAAPPPAPPAAAPPAMEDARICSRASSSNTAR